MIEPNGPLPAGVYWRRRVVAVVASVSAVVVLAWVVGAFVGAADDEPVRTGAGDGEDPRPSSSPPPADPAASASASATASVSASATSSAAAPTTSPAATPSSAAPPPGPPGPCPDAAVRVTAQVGAPTYRVGERPELRLVVVNAGKVPCVRDVNRALRELLIFTADGKTRLWSSNDCYAPPGADVRTLAPGRPAVFDLRWAGRTSEPGCPLARRTVQAGSYRLIGRLGALAGPPVPLVLTP